MFTIKNTKSKSWLTWSCSVETNIGYWQYFIIMFFIVNLNDNDTNWYIQINAYIAVCFKTFDQATYFLLSTGNCRFHVKQKSTWLMIENVFKIKNSNKRQLMQFWYLYCWLWASSSYLPTVFTADIEHVCVCWGWCLDPGHKM